MNQWIKRTNQLLTISALLLWRSLHGAGQVVRLPKLGDSVPAPVERRHISGKTCDTGDGHDDPCATIHIRRTRTGTDTFTIAWDQQTERVTYLYSDTLSGDSELGAGGSVRIGPSPGASPIATEPFIHWLISPQWRETASYVSGDAVWWVALRPDSESSDYCDIEGFVQSVYPQFPKEY